ncbi:unnamed protein product [Lactuca virosa]|uniref:Flavin-containing monooxygenase n=1 Tax=Lactuca virosa TaxID=75947 RepID=A0AAU9NT34_9ASTR|nr:unnamed protein product [Lactuca virosa]
MLCFRYNYHIPFLKVNGILSIQEKCIGPLYKHVFPPRLAPRLSFVGIPKKTLAFPIAETQSRWIAHTLSRKVLLPSEDEMLNDVEEYYHESEGKGIPKHHIHTLGFEKCGRVTVDVKIDGGAGCRWWSWLDITQIREEKSPPRSMVVPNITRFHCSSAGEAISNERSSKFHSLFCSPCSILWRWESIFVE